MRREPQSGHSGLVPYQIFATADGDLMVCVGNDRLFAKFCEILERPEWVTDPSFATNRARLANRDRLVPLIAAEFVHRSRADWCESFAVAGVPCAPVNSLREAVALEQFAASEMLGPPLADGAMQLIGTPISFDGVRRHANAIAPRLGADNARFIEKAAVFNRR
jgi:formyl-CoA transferase